MTNRAEVAQLLGILNVAYPHRAMDAEQLKLAVPVWSDLLGDLPFNILKIAVTQHCTESQWFPSVAEIRKAAFELMAPDEDMVTPLEAWSEAKRAAVDANHQWSSAIVKQAFDAIGGRGYFRYALQESEMADRSRFVQAFEVLQKRQRYERRMLPAVREFVGQHRQLTLDDNGDANKLIGTVADKLRLPPA